MGLRAPYLVPASASYHPEIEGIYQETIREVQNRTLEGYLKDVTSKAN